MFVTLISFRGTFKSFWDLTEVSAQSWYTVRTYHLVNPTFKISLLKITNVKYITWWQLKLLDTFQYTGYVSFKSQHVGYLHLQYVMTRRLPQFSAHLQYIFSSHMRRGLHIVPKPKPSSKLVTGVGLLVSRHACMHVCVCRIMYV